jgi:hypothetical protein
MENPTLRPIRLFICFPTKAQKRLFFLSSEKGDD